MNDKYDILSGFAELLVLMILEPLRTVVRKFSEIPSNRVVTARRMTRMQISATHRAT